jgi:hypothetical protein
MLGVGFLELILRDLADPQLSGTYPNVDAVNQATGWVDLDSLYGNIGKFPYTGADGYRDATSGRIDATARTNYQTAFSPVSEAELLAVDLMIHVHNFAADYVLGCLNTPVNTPAQCVDVADKFAPTNAPNKPVQAYRVARYVTLGVLHRIATEVLATFNIPNANLNALGTALPLGPNIPLASAVDFTVTLTQAFTADPCGGARNSNTDLADRLYRAQHTGSSAFGSTPSDGLRYTTSNNQADDFALGPYSLWSNSPADATFSFYDGIHQHPGYASPDPSSWNQHALALTASVLLRNLEADAPNYDSSKLSLAGNIVKETTGSYTTGFNTLSTLFSNPLWVTLGTFLSNFDGTPFVPTQDCPPAPNSGY